MTDVMPDMLAFQNSVADKLQSALGLRASVTLVESGAIERAAGMAERTAGGAAAHTAGGEPERTSGGTVKRVLDLRDQG